MSTTEFFSTLHYRKPSHRHNPSAKINIKLLGNANITWQHNFQRLYVNQEDDMNNYYDDDDEKIELKILFDLNELLLNRMVQRRNLNELELRTMVVIREKKLTGPFQLYLEDIRDRHLDTFPRMNFAILLIAKQFFNLT